MLDYGRMHIRNEMCDIIVVVTVGNMAKFGTEDYDKLMQSIAELRDKCMRKDYNAGRTDKPNRKMMSERRYHTHFTKRADNVLTFLEITKLSNPLRPLRGKFFGEDVLLGPVSPEILDEQAQADLL